MEPPEELRSTKEHECLRWIEEEASAQGLSASAENWWECCTRQASQHGYSRALSDQERAMWRDSVRMLLTYGDRTPEECAETATRMVLLSRLGPLLGWIAGFWPEGHPVGEELGRMGERCEWMQDEVAQETGLMGAWNLEEHFERALRSLDEGPLE